jgi:hypothetical protein
MNQLFNLNMLKPFKAGDVGVWAPAVDILDEKDHIKDLLGENLYGTI